MKSLIIVEEVLPKGLIELRQLLDYLAEFKNESKNKNKATQP